MCFIYLFDEFYNTKKKNILSLPLCFYHTFSFIKKFTKSPYKQKSFKWLDWFKRQLNKTSNINSHIICFCSFNLIRTDYYFQCTIYNMFIHFISFHFILLLSFSLCVLLLSRFKKKNLYSTVLLALDIPNNPLFILIFVITLYTYVM